MIAQQVASKAVRDGFFLSEFDVTALPLAMLAAGIVSVVAALALGKFIATFSPAGAVPVLFAANGLLFFAEAALVDTMPRGVAVGLYMHTAAFGGAVVSGFWSVMNERFDPYTARKVVAQIAAGATAGGVVGGVATWLLAGVGTAVLLVAFGVSSCVCAGAIAAVAERHVRGRTSRARVGLLSGLSVLAHNSYPRRVGMVVFFGALMTGLIDYVFKAGVVSARSGESLVGFFAVFYTAVGVATFVLQAVGTKKVLKGIGVVPTAGIFPTTALSFLLMALILPGLITLVLLRGAAMVVENSLYRAGYELFYTPVPKQQKRSAKMLIDLGCDRLGTAIASGIALLAIGVGAATANKMLLVIAVACAVVIAIIMVAIRREYLTSLADQLRSSLVTEPLYEEANPARALAATFVADIDVPTDSNRATEDGGATTSNRAIDHDVLIRQVQERAERKRYQRQQAAALRALPVSQVSEQLLATPLRARLRTTDLSDADWEELRRTAPGVIGQLGDILLSRRETLDVRLRVCELLAAVPSKRASDVLLEVLQTSGELRLRRASALALLAICTAAPALSPRRRVLVDLAARELRRPSRAIRTQSEFERASPFLTDARGNTLAPNLELVFVLLAIGGHTEELRLALTAVASDDSLQRGTGLEYLDNLLPGDLRRHLVGLAENPELTQAELRLEPSVVQRLAAELRSGALEIRTLRRRYREAQRKQYDQG